MSETNDIIELDLNGKIVSKKGEFENESDDKLNEVVKKIFYILEDINNIKNKKPSLGNFQKLTIKDSNIQYEIAIGNSSIKIYKFDKN